MTCLAPVHASKLVSSQVSKFRGLSWLSAGVDLGTSPDLMLPLFFQQEETKTLAFVCKVRTAFAVVCLSFS